MRRPASAPRRDRFLREDYNYKSLAAVAHTPGWNGTPVADDRGKDLSIRLRIGCVFGSRNGIFCRALHTQVLEVIEFAVSRATLKICWASRPWGFDSPSRHHKFPHRACPPNLLHPVEQPGWLGPVASVMATPAPRSFLLRSSSSNCSSVNSPICSTRASGSCLNGFCKQATNSAIPR